MSFGGLGLAGVNNANKKPTKKCERCELRYPEEEETCTHCGTLDDRGLLKLKERIEKEGQAHTVLGKKLNIIAFILFIVLLISYLK